MKKLLGIADNINWKKILTYQIGNIPVTKIIVIYEIIFWFFNFLFSPFHRTGIVQGWGISWEHTFYGEMFGWALGVPIGFILLVLVWHKWPKNND